MGIFKDIFGIGEHDNARFNHRSTSDGVRTVRVSYDDKDKGGNTHETTFSKTDYATGAHVEGWHGDKFPH